MAGFAYLPRVLGAFETMQPGFRRIQADARPMIHLARSEPKPLVARARGGDIVALAITYPGLNVTG